MKHLVLPLSLYLVLAAITITVPVACGGIDCKDPANATSPKCVATSSVVDCTKTAVDAALAEAANQQVGDLVKSATNPDGSINTASITDKLIEYAKKFGGCLISEIFSKWVFPSQTAAAGPGPHPTPEAAKATFEAVRAQLWQGQTYKTSAGTL